jgi:hypothetical protein
MKRRDRLAAHFIRASDLRAVYLASAGRTVRLGITRDPVAKARELKRQRAKLHQVYWLASSAAAALLLRAAAEAFPGIDRGAKVRAASVEDALPALAQDYDLAITPEAVVQERAAAAVADIDRRVKAMQASGHLRGLTGQYRQARMEASRTGAPFMSYGDYLERYKIKMLYQIADALKAAS